MPAISGGSNIDIQEAVVDQVTMSLSTKRPRIDAAAGGASGDIAEVGDSSLQNHKAVANPANVDNSTTRTSANDFSSDVIAIILSYLKLREIMCKRRVCKKWTDAVRKTPVSPEEEFEVNNVKTYEAMSVMSTVFPNLQSVRIMPFMNNIEALFNNIHHKYNDGEDPDEEMAAYTANFITHDIEIISAFRKLRRLEINDAPLNGRYPFLFHFPLLQKLSITSLSFTILKWDLEVLTGLPMLKELKCVVNRCLTGNIRSLRVLKDTLEKVTLDHCPNVEGNFMALADFPQLTTLKLRETAVILDIGDLVNGDFARLEELGCLGIRTSLVSGNIRNLRVIKDTLEHVTIAHSDNVSGSFMDLADFPKLRTLYLRDTAVTGDIRDISSDDFSKLEQLALPSTIYGGNGYELQRISDAPELMKALHLLKKQHPSLTLKDWHGKLSENSPDWYAEDYVPPPFEISLVEARTRIGYRWKDDLGEEHCEVNWLDPVPDEESSDYEEFLDDLRKIENEGGNFYKGYHQPPTQEEYNRLIAEE